MGKALSHCKHCDEFLEVTVAPSESRNEPSRLCSFCENRAATVGKYCPKCAQLADDALDEIAGGPGEFEKMLAKHLAKGTRQ
jgi:predicted amidophosphoribosyltransferase